MRDFKVGRRGSNLAFYFVILDVIRLKLYTVDNSYIKQLYNVDTEVFYEPTGYDIKPYVGIIIQNNNSDLSYLALLEKELKFIRPLWKTIQNKANAIYLDQKETGIVRNFYCNFSKLENVYQQSMSSNLITV